MSEEVVASSGNQSHFYTLISTLVNDKTSQSDFYCCEKIIEIITYCFREISLSE